MNYYKKIMKRADALSIDLEHFHKVSKKQIWEIDYLSSSDEEDNDSVGEESQDSEDHESSEDEKGEG